MDREERLRRKRQYRARWNRETAEGAEAGTRRARERCWCAMMSTEQRQILLQWRYHSESIAESQPLEIPSVDDRFVVREFYNHLYGLSMVKCTLLYDACVNYAMQES